MSLDPAISAILPSQAVESREDPLEQEVVALFDEFRGKLLRYVMTFGLTVFDAEEIIQEVFLSLFRHLQRGGSRSNLRAWLFRVAHNQGLKRRQKNRLQYEPMAEEAVHASGDPNPEDQLLSTQSHRRLLAAVQALPENDRRCLELRAEGLRYREIAGVVGMSLGAVSLSLARSLARVARCAQR